MSQNPAILEKLTTARVGLLLKAPFFGNMATRMQIIQADDWCPTAATNGKNFYYRGMAWEEIYDKLYEQAEKIPMDQLLKQLGDLLDEHINEDGNGNGSGKDSDKEGNGSGRPTISKEEAQKIRDEIKEAMIQSAAAAGAGKVPAGIQRLIKDLTEPKMNWREMLRMNIQSIVRNDYSFARYNRKSAHSGAILPGLKNDETIDVAIAIDMSGSIGDEDATTFLSEIKGIMDQYTDFAIDLWCFDTEIYNHQRITHDNGDDLLTYEPKGGGGTDFEANFNYMKDIGLTPKKFIMFTDGYPCGSWGDEDYADTLFIVKGNTNAEAPFGQTVIYEKDAQLVG